MRLFVSINLGEELNEYLAGVQEGLRKIAGGGRGGGLSGSEVGLKFAGLKSGFHLTLFFLGEVSVEKVLDLQKELKKISFESFKLRFKKKLGVFKGGGGRGGGFIKAVFVDIDGEGEGFSKLLNLQKKVAEVIGRFGFGGGGGLFGGRLKPAPQGGAVGGGRPFSPHITLARVGFCPADCAEEFERAVLGLEISQQEFDVSSFYLMESHLGADGLVYDEVLKVDGK